MLHTVYSNLRGYIPCGKLAYIPWGILYTAWVSSRNDQAIGNMLGGTVGNILYTVGCSYLYTVWNTLVMYIPWGTIYRGEHIVHGIYVCPPQYIQILYTVGHIPWGTYLYTVGKSSFNDDERMSRYVWRAHETTW